MKIEIEVNAENQELQDAWEAVKKAKTAYETAILTLYKVLHDTDEVQGC